MIFDEKKCSVFLYFQDRPPSYPGVPEQIEENIEENSVENESPQTSSACIDRSIVNMISINGMIMAKYLDKQAGFCAHIT